MPHAKDEIPRFACLLIHRSTEKFGRSLGQELPLGGDRSQGDEPDLCRQVGEGLQDENSELAELTRIVQGRNHVGASAQVEGSPQGE